MPRRRPRRRRKPLLSAALFVAVVCVGALYYSSLEGDEATAHARRLAEGGASRKALSGGLVVIHILGVMYMFLALAVSVDEFFVPALESIGDELDLTPDISGATLMAAGGSAPELFTSFVGTFTNSAIGFGTIVGSAVFNVLFVIAMVALFSEEVLKLTWWPLFRDCTYYTFALGVLAAFFRDGTIQLFEAVALFCMYFGYVLVMARNEKLLALALRFSPNSSPAPLSSETAKTSAVVEMASTVVVRANAGYDASAEGEEEEAVVEAETSSDTPMEDARRRASFAMMEMAAHHVSFVRPSTFRAGVLQMMLSGRPMAETAGMGAVTKISGGVRATFDQIDEDGNGVIDLDELLKLLQRFDRAATEEEAQMIFHDLDTDGDGSISFDEFQTWYVSSEMRLKQDVGAVFDEIDSDNDGYVSKSEVEALLRKLGNDPTDEELEEGLSALDLSSDGRVDRDEFVIWYQASFFYDTHLRRQHSEAMSMRGLRPWHCPSGRTIEQVVTHLAVLPLMVCLVHTVPDVRKQHLDKYRYVAFVMSICWIGVFSFLMVTWAEAIGATLGIPDEVMGLTVLAAGTSVPDLLSSVVVAKKGFGDMAVSSSIGSNIFDVLVGLPLPWLCFSLSHDNTAVTVGSETLKESLLILLGMLVCVVALIKINDWKVTRKLGGAMFLLYALYVTFALCRVYAPGIKDW
jgi:sodium/potassium/calcium exchanger 2